MPKSSTVLIPPASGKDLLSGETDQLENTGRTRTSAANGTTTPRELDLATRERTDSSDGTKRGRLRPSGKATLCGLVAILALGLILRYPSSGHMAGTDGFWMAGLVEGSVQVQGFPWAIEVFDYFGLSSYSYATAYPALLASVRTMTGLNVESAALFLSLLLYVMGTLGSFCLGWKVKRHGAFALAVALAFSVSPYFIRLTRWEASARVLLLSLLPAVVLLLVMLVQAKSRRKLMLPLLLVVLVALAAHRSAVLFIPLILGAFLVSMAFWGTRDAPARMTAFRAGIAIAFVLAFSVLVLNQLLGLVPPLPPHGGGIHPRVSAGRILSGSHRSEFPPRLRYHSGTSLRSRLAGRRGSTIQTEADFGGELVSSRSPHGGSDPIARSIWTHVDPTRCLPAGRLWSPDVGQKARDKTSNASPACRAPGLGRPSDLWPYG